MGAQSGDISLCVGHFQGQSPAQHSQNPETLIFWSVRRALPAQGAVVANYPWDGSEDRGTHYSACPDDAAYIHLASVYARAHASMAASAEFPGGITNGAAWYPLWGGMQARSELPRW